MNICRIKKFPKMSIRKRHATAVDIKMTYMLELSQRPCSKNKGKHSFQEWKPDKVVHASNHRLAGRERQEEHKVEASPCTK